MTYIMTLRSDVRMCAAILFLLLFSVFVAGQEPVKPPASPRIITATKQVTLFSGLEIQLLQAIQKKDRAALQALLSDDFVISMPDADLVAGEDWLEDVAGKDYSLKSFAVRGFFVSDLGSAAMVIFERSQDATYKGKADAGQFFVVDLWKKNGDSWKLAHRAVSKTSSLPAAAKPPRKPTGKQ